MNRESKSLREIYLFVAIGCGALVAVGCDDMMNGEVDDAYVAPSQEVDQTYQPNDSAAAPAAVPMGQTDPLNDTDEPIGTTDSTEQGGLFDSPGVDVKTPDSDLEVDPQTSESDEVIEEVSP